MTAPSLLPTLSHAEKDSGRLIGASDTPQFDIYVDDERRSRQRPAALLKRLNSVSRLVFNLELISMTSDPHDQQSGPSPSFLDKQGAALALGISKRTLDNLVKAKIFPPGVRLGRSLFWSQAVIKNWRQELFAAQEAWRSWAPGQSYAARSRPLKSGHSRQNPPRTFVFARKNPAMLIEGLLVSTRVLRPLCPLLNLGCANGPARAPRTRSQCEAVASTRLRDPQTLSIFDFYGGARTKRHNVPATTAKTFRAAFVT